MFESNISRQKYQKAKEVQLGGISSGSASVFGAPTLKKSHHCNIPTSSVHVSVEKHVEGRGEGEKSAMELADELRAAHEARQAENAARLRQSQRNLSQRIHNYHEQQKGINELLEEEKNNRKIAFINSAAKKQKVDQENIPQVDLAQQVMEAFPTRAAQLRMDEAKERGSEYWSKRQWYMEQERSRAKDRVERKLIEERRIREEVALQAEIARQNELLYQQQQHEHEEKQRQANEAAKRQKELERQKKIHNAEKMRVQRYLEGLRVKLIQRLAYNNIQLPPICECSTDPLAHNVANCHRSCPYYKQPEMYNDALMEILNSYGIAL